MRIDAHQHFWHFDPVRDSWITDEMSVIQRDFVPEDLEGELESKKIDGSVAVQADQSLDETEFLLSLAHQFEFVKGVVGWVDLLSGSLDSDLERYADDRFFVGVRHILQAELEDFMLQKKFLNGVESLSKYDSTYDILIHEKQLSEAVQMVKKLPVMPLVIDHIAKPDIANKSFTHWKEQMSKMSEMEHVFVKLSGMVTEASWSEWKTEDFVPYFDHIIESFGPKRIMFGSDWPVCLLGGNYVQITNLAEELIDPLSEDEQSHIMGLNAANFYNLQ